HARAAAARDAPGSITSAGDLDALDVRDAPGRAYIDDLAWALAFAAENRRRIADRALDVLESAGGDVRAATPPSLDAASRSNAIDVHHNFVARETWGGRDVLVHRKGAIAAPPGAFALIPGSMGTASYIVRGLGNPEAFGSCSHGAGRVLSRREA